MANKQKRNNLPECRCLCCINLKADRLRKYKLDEATDVNNPRTGLRRAAVECTCGCSEHSVSNMRSNRGTFIKFSGPTKSTSLNPAASVIPSNLNTGSTSGCFLEKNSDGKSRAFDLETSDVPVKAPDEYFRSITVWKGVLIKPVFVTTSRASCLAVQQRDRSNNGLLPSKYNFFSGRSQLEEKGSHRNKNPTFYSRRKVGTWISFLKPLPRNFRLQEFF